VRIKAAHKALVKSTPDGTITSALGHEDKNSTQDKKNLSCTLHESLGQLKYVHTENVSDNLHVHM